MARPLKAGLDYFPLDVTLDEKIELIEAKHGLLGFGLVIKLFQNIYKNGYYLDATEERLLLLKKRFNVEYDFIVGVVDSGCKWKIFSEKLFEKHSILTSCGIQKRFIEATKRRKEVDFIKEYLMVKDVESYYKAVVNVNIVKLNVNINLRNDDSGTHSKGKESKVKEKPPIIPLPDFIDAELWEQFMLVRKKRKAVSSEYANKLLINKIKKYHAAGFNVNEIIETSVENSWKSFFPPKNNGSKKNDLHEHLVRVGKEFIEDETIGQK